MKRLKIYKFFSWTVPFVPALIYGFTSLPPLMTTSSQGVEVSIGFILLATVLIPVFLGKQQFIKSRVILFTCMFLGLLAIGTIISQLTWIMGLTTLGVGLDEMVFTPLIKYEEAKLDV